MADDFKTRAFQFFVSQGYAPHQAAALAAHADQESGGNTRAVHDKGTGVGIMGWRDPEPGKGRKTELFNWAKTAGPNGQPLDPYSEEAQLLFVTHEMNNKERAAGDRLRGATTYQDAINATLGYLRPQGYTAANPYGSHNYTGRYNAGAQLAGVQPLVGDAVAAAGGNNAPPAPTAGLMAPSTPVDTTAAAAAVEQARKDKEQEEAYAGLMKSGLGLLNQATPEPMRFASAPIDIHAPEAKPVALPNYRQQVAQEPDFMQMLMQQRLQRRT